MKALRRSIQWIFTALALFAIAITSLKFFKVSLPPFVDQDVLLYFISASLMLLERVVNTWLHQMPVYFSCKIYKKTEKVTNFMVDLVKSDGDIVVFSKDAGWLKEESIYNTVTNRAEKQQSHYKFILTNHPSGLDSNKYNCLLKLGVKFVITNIDAGVRFTLRGSSKGSKRLAIAAGSVPEHRICEYTEKEAPDIIALAEKVVELSEKETNNLEVKAKP